MRRRSRWTILNVPESIIKIVRNHATENGFTTEKSLSDLVEKGKKRKINTHQEN